MYLIRRRNCKLCWEDHRHLEGPLPGCMHVKDWSGYRSFVIFSHVYFIITGPHLVSYMQMMKNVVNIVLGKIIGLSKIQ